MNIYYYNEEDIKFLGWLNNKNKEGMKSMNNVTNDVRKTIRDLEHLTDAMKTASNRSADLKRNMNDVNELLMETIFTSIHTIAETINLLNERVDSLEEEMELKIHQKKKSLSTDISTNDILKEITESM